MSIKLFAALALTVFPAVAIGTVAVMWSYAKWEDSRASE